MASSNPPIECGGSEESVVTEDLLEVNRLFLRSQLASPATGQSGIDYPTEMQCVLLLNGYFLFLYDNRLYRSPFYENFRSPQLVLEDRIVSICLVNKELNQLLALFESNGTLNFLLFSDNPMSITPQIEPLLCPLASEWMIAFDSYNRLRAQQNAQTSVLQDNYSISMRYFPETSTLMLACNPLLYPHMNQEAVGNSGSQWTGKVLQIVVSSDVDDESADLSIENEKTDGVLCAQVSLELDARMLRDGSVYSVWIARPGVTFAVMATDDSAVWMWPLQLPRVPVSEADCELNAEEDDTNETETETATEQNSAEHDTSTIQSKSFTDPKRESESKASSEFWRSFVSTESNRFEPSKSKTSSKHSSRSREKDRPIRMQTKHRGFVTALSDTQWLDAVSGDVEAVTNYAATGDALGCIVVYRYVTPPVLTAAEREQRLKQRQQEGYVDETMKPSPWHICDLRRNSTNGFAITALRVLVSSSQQKNEHQRQKSPQQVRLLVGDRQGVVQILQITTARHRLQMLQQLSLFSSLGCVSSFASSTGNDDCSSLLLRCYSEESGEAVECLVLESMQRVFKILPESLVDDADNNSATQFQRSEYQCRFIVDRCCLLLQRNLLLVCSFTRELHIYDLLTMHRRYSFFLSADQCSALLAWPTRLFATADSIGMPSGTSLALNTQRITRNELEGFDESDAFTVVCGHTSGVVVVYHIYLKNLTDENSDSITDARMSIAASHSSVEPDRSIASNRKRVSPVKTRTEAEDSSDLFDLLDAKKTNVTSEPADVSFQLAADAIDNRSALSADIHENDPISEHVVDEDKATHIHVCTLTSSPLAVTDLFVSSLGRVLVSIHIKQFLFAYGVVNVKVDPTTIPLHSRSAPNLRESDKRGGNKTMPTPSVDAKSQKGPKNKVLLSSIAGNKSIGNKKSGLEKLDAAGMNSQKNSLAAVEGSGIITTLQQFRFERRASSISTLQATRQVAGLDQQGDGGKEDDGDDNDDDDRIITPTVKQGKNDDETDRLVLVLCGPETTVIRLFDALVCKPLLDLPLPQFPFNMTNPATMHVTSHFDQTRVCAALLWDHELLNSAERGLIGFCPSIKTDEYLCFNEAQGFQVISDREHSQWLQYQVRSTSSFEYNVYVDSWQRNQLMGIETFGDDSAPVVCSWSSYHCQLMRVQLHVDRGALLMRSKHYFTHKATSPTEVNASIANNNRNRILFVKSLSKSKRVRRHQALVVLSNGYGIVIHL